MENIISVVDTPKISEKKEEIIVQKKISSIPQSVIKFAAKAQRPQEENHSEIHLDTTINCQESHLMTFNSQPELTVDVYHSTIVEEKSTQRKLLSPYLKPPPAVLNNTTDASAAEAFPKIHQPPKTTHTRKTLDQFEMYRRILMSTEPEEETKSGTMSSTVAASQSDINAKKEDTTIIIQPNDLISSTESAATWKHSKEYFSEMHWRKRTSQCFISQSDFQLS